MADRPRLPFDPRQRDEPDSDRPERDERPFRSPQRPRFVTVDEMNAAIAEALEKFARPIMASQQRLENEAIASRIEREARKMREEQERQDRERKMSDAVREKLESESDLIKAQAEALQRPQTPMVLPIQLQPPKAADSSPEPGKQKYNRTHVIIAVIGLVSAVSVAAIGACNSQRTSPHGGYIAPTQPTQGHTP